MPISDADLLAQYRRAEAEWPWIAAVERAVKLPPMLLWAVGSRETNLRNVIGDGGHGIGIWQRDRRAWTLPATSRGTSRTAPPNRDAAALLLGLRGKLGAWPAAVAAYNAGEGAVRKALAAGVDPDSRTTAATTRPTSVAARPPADHDRPPGRTGHDHEERHARDHAVPSLLHRRVRVPALRRPAARWGVRRAAGRASRWPVSGTTRAA